MADAESSVAGGEYATPLLAAHPNLLKNRNFVLLWAGNVISALGDRIHMLVMLALVSKIVGDHLAPPNPNYEAGTMESAQLTVMMLAPFLLFGPITGLLADRLPRRAIMICSDLARVVIVIVARTIFLREQGTQANAQSEYVMLYSLLLGSEFILATFGAAFSPARMALLPQLVHPDQLLRANSLTTAAGTIASLLGFVAGGLLVTHSLHVAMYVDAGTFLASAICLAFMKLSGVPRRTQGQGGGAGGKESGPLRDLAEGVAYIRGHRRVMQITWLLLLYWSCGAIILSGLTGIVTRYYHLPIANYGYFLGVIGLGMVLGAASVSLFRHGIPKEIGVAWAMVGVGGFLLAFAQMSQWQSALVLVTLAATCGAVMLVSLETLVQRIVPNHVRGRIMGVKDVITNIGMVGLTIPLALWPDVDSFIFLVLRILSVVVMVVGLGLVVYYYRRRPLGLSIPGSIVLRLARGYLGLWQRYQRVGPCRVPGGTAGAGAVIVVANHTSGLDPVILQASSPRRIIHFMMAREYYEKWPLSLIYKAFGAIPVNRTGNDIAAVRLALRALQEGKVLGLFPEGKISMDGSLQEGRPGVAAIALMSGATVVPACITGTRRHQGMLSDFMGRARVRIKYGKPLRANDLVPGAGATTKNVVRDEATLRAVTERIMGAIRELQITEESA